MFLTDEQYYAKKGLKTCLVVNSLDPVPSYLMDCKIGTSPVLCNENLFAVRLETTKVIFFLSHSPQVLISAVECNVTFLNFLQMLLEPLDQVKKADTRINFSQGALEGVGM